MEARILKWQEMGTKHAKTDDFDAIRKESIRKEEEKRRIDRINKQVAKVPFRFRHKTFKDYQATSPEQAKVKIIAERFVATFPERLKEGTSMMCLGKPGTGKTFLSLIIYQALAKESYNVHYESSLQFLRAIQEKRYSSHASFESIIDFYNNVQFLILDEVTESISKDGYPSEYDRRLLFEIINQRYAKQELCTLIISNRDKGELINRLGQPIIDRLSEKGIQLIFNWDSYR